CRLATRTGRLRRSGPPAASRSGSSNRPAWLIGARRPRPPIAPRATGSACRIRFTNDSQKTGTPRSSRWKMSRDPVQEWNLLTEQAGKLFDQGRFSEALDLAARARDLARRSVGEGHPDYATSLNNLAVLYRAMGDYASALPLHRQAMEIYRAAVGEGHPLYAASLDNLAGLYEAMGDYPSALPLPPPAIEVCRPPGRRRHPRH